MDPDALHVVLLCWGLARPGAGTNEQVGVLATGGLAKAPALCQSESCYAACAIVNIERNGTLLQYHADIEKQARLAIAKDTCLHSINEPHKMHRT